MKKSLIALSIAGFAGLTAPVLAQIDLTGIGFDTSVLASVEYGTVDADMSGGVSFDELAVFVPDLTQEAFAAIDTDMSGEISVEEYAAVTPEATAN